MESILLCIQILLFHLSELFSYLNTPWSQHVRISDFQLYLRFFPREPECQYVTLCTSRTYKNPSCQNHLQACLPILSIAPGILAGLIICCVYRYNAILSFLLFCSIVMCLRGLKKSVLLLDTHLDLLAHEVVPQIPCVFSFDIVQYCH